TVAARVGTKHRLRKQRRVRQQCAKGAGQGSRIFAAIQLTRGPRTHWPQHSAGRNPVKARALGARSSSSACFQPGWSRSELELRAPGGGGVKEIRPTQSPDSLSLRGVSQQSVDGVHKFSHTKRFSEDIDF